MIFGIYFSIFIVILATFSGFLWKQKINKWQLFFIVYYFCVFFAFNLLNNFISSYFKEFTNNKTTLVLFSIIAPLVVIIFAIPATFFTARWKKRKIYIWWLHFIMITSCILGLFINNIWILIFTNVALGITMSTMGVHQLMFNEQYFRINKGFLSFTILLVPPLLSNLLIYPIQFTLLNNKTDTSQYWFYFYLVAFIFLLVSLIISYFLKEERSRIGIYDDFILKKIKTYQWKKFLILVVLGMIFYVVYYLLSNNLLNYKIDAVNSSKELTPYLLLLTTCPEVVGVLFLGYFLYVNYGIRKTLNVILVLWIIAIFGFLFFDNVYALAIITIILNISFGISFFIIYSLVLEWNFRQTAPLTGIYAAIIAISTFNSNLLSSLTNFNIINVSQTNSSILFYVFQFISMFTLFGLFIFSNKSIDYWSTEEKLIMELKRSTAEK